MWHVPVSKLQYLLLFYFYNNNQFYLYQFGIVRTNHTYSGHVAATEFIIL